MKKPKTIPQVILTETKLPLPYKDESVEEVSCVHVLSKIPGKQRGPFMDELHRILVPGGKCTVIVPYYSSMRSIMDYTYEWPPLCEMSFLYFNKGWREANKVNGISCDFDFTYGYQATPETASRAIEVQQEWIKKNLNSVNDLQVNLVKR